jgi:hypothetical protein
MREYSPFTEDSQYTLHDLRDVWFRICRLYNHDHVMDFFDAWQVDLTNNLSSI